MNKVRTVSDTKRAFYTFHTRPVNSIFRRVVEELMVEMHLLRVNDGFRYDPIFGLGVVTTYDRFMDGYQPAADQASIFQALCKAEEVEPEALRQDSQRLLALSQAKSAEELLQWFSQSATSGGDDIQMQLQDIARNSKFKYSRLFAIGLFTMLEHSDADLVKEEAQLNPALKRICEALGLSENKVQKDLELYRSNLTKMTQARQTMADIVEADRQRRLQADAEKSKTENEGSDDTASPDADAPLEVSS